ncbi:MAG: YcxB family protein [Clostridia bacterium]|nr:YcxB family protein [Clostridia bacterium]
MTIETKTTYTRERLLRANDYFALSRKWLWWTLGICTIIIISCSVLMLALGSVDSTVMLCLALNLIIDATTILMYFVVPRLTIKKASILNSTLEASFGEDEVHLKRITADASVEQTAKYSLFYKAVKHKGDLILFISKVQIYVIDLGAMSADECELLKALLVRKLTPERVKW